ncbi:MAG: DUF3794 domain-containing protein [Clostridiales bacterium]|nr:DUF3794 domain-containing protein [Clostridiales bacterium]MCF8022101.1 DUF3794 domain-containing protein [Clostridiales bacterium]
MKKCIHNGTVEVIGLCDPETIQFEDVPAADAVDRNWTEISIPEVLAVPDKKPSIEQINKVFIDVKIISQKIISTPNVNTENLEGSLVTGRKLIIEGMLEQKVLYTADVPEQSIHTTHFNVPFSAFIVLREDTTLEDEFDIDICVEDVFVDSFSPREIFKNVTLFLRARPAEDDTGCP